MASDREFVEFIVDQIKDAGDFGVRKMFGEYAIFGGGRIVALIADNQLFVKATGAGRALIGTPTEAPPYPGARPWFLIDEVDDREWLARLIRETDRALPPAAPPRARKGSRK